MKSRNLKFGLIFTIFFNVSIVISLIIGFYLVFFKIEVLDRIDKKTFVDYMENKGCKVVDVLNEEELDGMDDYLVTTKDTCPYLISYATFNNENVLQKFF